MENKTGNMETMRSYKFRIYPETKRQQAIGNAISLSRRLYNRLLEKAIALEELRTYPANAGEANYL